jgi:hypothetical protein
MGSGASCEVEQRPFVLWREEPAGWSGAPRVWGERMKGRGHSQKRNWVAPLRRQVCGYRTGSRESEIALVLLGTCDERRNGFR